jgi:aminopeptidase YwaD
MIQKSLAFLLFFLPYWACAQKGTEKIDASPIGKLKKDIEYLASDELEGRMAGSKGETLAANYIEKRFAEIGIPSYKGSKYQWDFTIKDGKRVGSNAYFKINDIKLTIGSDIIPMPYGSGDRIKGAALPFVEEENNVWMISMKSIKADASNRPFKVLYEKANACIKNGATAIVFFNDIAPVNDINIINHPKFESLSVPVVVVNHKAYLNTIQPNMKKDWIDIDAKMGYEDANMTGKNVIAMIDNNAPLTIVVTAHYDHLGINGEIFNGANNNASGVASLLAIAEMIKLNNLKQYNYLFIAFSGSKFNNQGAISFLQANKTAFNYDCLIDLNMLGRFNKVVKSLFVTGVGTSTVWGSLLNKNNKGFVLKIDSAGIGYGAYSLFYKKSVPLLSFSTGYSNDFAKPTDDAIKINYTSQVEINNFIYKIISDLDKMPRISFTETFNMAEKLENLKNDLGFIPDYSFPDNGIRIATCLTNKLADKAGLEAEDIIIQISDFRIIDFDDYIEAMNKSEKGKEVSITVKRGKNEFKFFVVL